MPAHRLNLMAFERFLFECAKSPTFTPDLIVPAIQELGGNLSLFDKLVIYPVAVHLMRARLVMLDQRLSFMLDKGPTREWGPGRVDTFAFAKALLNFRMDNIPLREQVGVVDFPSIWLQKPRIGMQLHWDGNNTSVEERNRSAAFGAGATPPTLDRQAMKRLEDWLLTREPPSYPFPINQQLAGKGEPIYREYCAGCHGTSGRNFTGETVGTVVPIADIKTDPYRLDSYTYELAINQNLLYAGNENPNERFSHFRKTNGYSNMPLDGIWLRAPYLHNGSVPTLRDLLEPRGKRPIKFYRGYDVYDQQRVGFVSTVSEEEGRSFFLFETTDALGTFKPRRTVAEQLAAGVGGLSYETFLTWRGMLEREPPRRPDPVAPAAPPSLRSEDWKFAFAASRCEACGERHLPPARVCAKCATVDRMVTERMADVPATIATFTVDRLAFTPSPPLVAAVLDFDGGGRFRGELTDVDPAAVKVGDRIEMTFRRITTAQGVHNYFWKGKPAR